MFIKKFLFLFCLLGLIAFDLSAAKKTSENNEKLKEWLERFPAADKNKDGILTIPEVLEYRKTLKGTKPKKSSSSAAKTTSGVDVPSDKAIKGYNGLFMGHSFFRPAAENLLKIIPDTNVVNHTELIVMSGGASGSPGRLWENESKRKAGQAYLDKGNVEFFAMTYFDKSNSGVEHYSKWFDYALQKNPNITFMIALPWGAFLFKASQTEIDSAEQGYKKLFDELIVTLRKKYPNNKIIYCPYGLGVYELINRLNAGNLPGIKHILNPKRSKTSNDQILRDPLGHGTELVTILSSLIWMQTIYNYDISTIGKKYRAQGLPDIDLNEIAAKVYKKVQPYNSIYIKK